MFIILLQTSIHKYAIIISLLNAFRSEVKTAKKSSKVTPQTGTKILVRNVPFQATLQEMTELFKCVFIYHFIHKFFFFLSFFLQYLILYL